MHSLAIRLEFMISDVSLIIPSQNAKQNLLNLLCQIPEWAVIPNEIIIVDSSDEPIIIPHYFHAFTARKNIKLLLIHSMAIYPGHARNIGIKRSNNNLLAFLDTSTSPQKTWLSSGLQIINTNNSQGVWGKTYYTADKFLSKIFQSSTYGGRPIKTLPGSIFKKEVFHTCGLFVESTRAGEDGDWVSRTKLHDVHISDPIEHLTYSELNKLTIKKIVAKWYRNNFHAARLPYSQAHRSLYFYGLALLAIVLAYNWNAVLASWDTNSALYVPNITKICGAILLTTYTLLRGIMLPFKKGISMQFILPINFIFISLFSGVLDITKVIAFVMSRFIRD